MEKTSNFTNKTNSSKMNYIENPRKFSDEMYSEAVEYLMDILKLTKKILFAYAVENPTPEDMTEEEIADFSEEERRQLIFMDDLDNFQWVKLVSFINDIGNNIYFNSRNICDLFVTSLEIFNTVGQDLKTNLDYAKEYDFKKDYEKDFKYILANLNYCAMVALGMFSFCANKCYVFMKYYCTKKNLKLEDIHNEMFEYYNDFKPNLTLFDSYPELALELEKIVSPEFFFDLANLSDMISKEELIAISKGELVVDSAYIELLEEKLRDSKETVGVD